MPKPKLKKGDRFSHALLLLDCATATRLGTRYVETRLLPLILDRLAGAAHWMQFKLCGFAAPGCVALRLSTSSKRVGFPLLLDTSPDEVPFVHYSPRLHAACLGAPFVSMGGRGYGAVCAALRAYRLTLPCVITDVEGGVLLAGELLRASTPSTQTYYLRVFCVCAHPLSAQQKKAVRSAFVGIPHLSLHVHFVLLCHGEGIRITPRLRILETFLRTRRFPTPTLAPPPGLGPAPCSPMRPRAAAAPSVRL